MKTKNLAITILTGALLAGCGGWQQNPLDGKKGNFGGAKPVPTKPDLTKPLDSKAVRISIPDFYSFQEGVVAEFPIAARVLLEGYQAEVVIDNLADFPGATYDKNTGVFRWTPPIGFVDSVGVALPVAQKPLVVRAYGYKPNDQVLVGDAERPMYISRDFKAPEILTINKPDSFVREGNTLLVGVEVFDKDAVATDRNTWPKLLLQSVANTKSLAGLTTFFRDESLGGSRYRIYLQVDAREVELSDSIDTFKVSVVAASRFGKLSLAREFSLDVYTSLAAPTTTWAETLIVKEEDNVNFKFLVTDPKLEGWLSLTRKFSLPAGSDVNCQPTARGLLACTFTWVPAVGTANVTYPFSLYIQSRNNDARDTMSPTKTLYFNVQVLPKGS
jgi:hypothetical protein